MAVTSEPANSNARAIATAKGWRHATFDALQVPAYRVVWSGTLLAFVAYMMINTTQSVVAFDLTGSNRAVGLVALGQGAAMCLLNPLGGALADRLSKRFLILGTHIFIAAVVLVLGTLIATEAITIWLLAGGSFLLGCVFVFIGPTRTAMVSEFVSEHQLGNAMALVQVANNFARISGPVLATVLIAWIGGEGAYYFIALLFFVILATYARIPDVPTRSTAQDKSLFEDIRLGLKHVRQNPRLLHLLVSFHILTILGMSNYVLMPGFAKETLDAGTTGLGALLGAMAVGGLICSLLVASLARSAQAPLLLTLASLALGLSLIVLGVVPNFGWAIVVMMFVGGTGSAFQTLNNAVAVGLTEPGYLGRVVSLMFLAWGIMSILSLPVGFLADIFGERVVLSGSGVALCAAVGLLYVWRLRIEAAERASALQASA